MGIQWKVSQDEFLKVCEVLLLLCLNLSSAEIHTNIPYAIKKKKEINFKKKENFSARARIFLFNISKWFFKVSK